MLKELVDNFMEHDKVSAEVYQDGLRIAMNVTFKSGMQMEISGMDSLDRHLPAYLLLTPDGAYSDPLMEDQLPTEIAKDYDILRTWDPRIIVNGIIPGSEKEEQGYGGSVEYDIRKLGLHIGTEDDHLSRALERMEYRFLFEFNAENGQLTQTLQQQIGGEHLMTLRFNYSNHE